MKAVFRSVLVAAAAALAVPAFASFAKPEDAVRYRQAAFRLMGNHFGRINAQLRSDKPDMQAIQTSASLVQTLSVLPFEAFGPGTDKGSTEARPEVWKESAKFKADAEKMQAEAAKLASVAKSGDAKAIHVQFGAVGAACKACHDDFKRN